MNNLKVWPHLTVVAVLCAVLAGAGVALWMDHEQNVAAEGLPNAARIQRVDGDVAFNNGFVSSQVSNANDTDWIAATPNQPITVGDRIYTRANSRAGLAFTGRNFARLNQNTSLDVLSLADRRTQLALRDGSAMFDVGYLSPGELFEVATPYGAVDLNQPGLYNIGIDNGSAVVSVLSGLAQVVGLSGSGQIGKGEVLTLLGQTAANVVLSRINGNDAGYLLNDYYGYQYPQYYDGRYQDYNAYLNDPYYYDPYRRDVGYQYVSSYIPGINDLDYYGDWRNLNGYGYAWCPRVDSGWAPYQDGYWMTDYPYGPTWVSSEPWGYAPYHYGRWANVSNQWFWIPDNTSNPRYAPALVAFLPFDQANEIGWVPLGPGDAYAPRYYDQNWQPYYLSRTRVVQSQVVNLNVPGAVTVVPVENFTRDIDRRSLRQFDRTQLAQTHAVLDPLTLTPLRNAVVHSAWGRGKIGLPPGISKKLETAVITSTPPVAPRFRRDLAQTLRAQAVPGGSRNQKLRFIDQRGGEQAQTVNRNNGEARQAERQQASQDVPQRQVAEQQQRQSQPQQQVRQLQQQRQVEQQLRRAQVKGESRQRVEQPTGERVGKPGRIQPQRAFQVSQPRQDQRIQRQEQRRVEVPRAQPRQQEIRTIPQPRQEQRIQRQEQRRVEVPRAQPRQQEIRTIPQPRQEQRIQQQEQRRVDVPRAQPRQQEERTLRAERQQRAADRPAPVQAQREQPGAKPQRQSGGGGGEGQGGGKGKGKKP